MFPWMHVRDVALLDREASQAGERLREVCGAFHSDKTGRLYLTFLANRARHLGQFRVLLKDVRFARGKGPFWGLFHSHPLSPAIPSDSDLSNGFGMALIYSDLEKDLRLWTLARGKMVDYEVKRLKVQPRAMS